MNKDNKNLGDMIVLLRKELKINQRDLARKVKITPAYLCDIEQGKRNPNSKDIINKFSKALKVKPDYLYYVSGRFPPINKKNKLNYSDFQRAMKSFRDTYRR